MFLCIHHAKYYIIYRCFVSLLLTALFSRRLPIFKLAETLVSSKNCSSEFNSFKIQVQCHAMLWKRARLTAYHLAHNINGAEQKTHAQTNLCFHASASSRNVSQIAHLVCAFECQLIKSHLI